jgi:hypothetical protein
MNDAGWTAANLNRIVAKVVTRSSTVTAQAAVRTLAHAVLMLALAGAAGCRGQSLVGAPDLPHAPQVQGGEYRGEDDEALIEHLASASHAVRAPAIEELARRAPRTIPRLLAALRAPRAKLAAARSLSLVADAETSVVAQLIEMLRSDNESIATKKAVAETLRHLGPKGSSAVPVLLRMVERGGIDTRILQRSPPDHRDWSAQAALASVGGAAVASVARLVSSESGQVRTDALRILARIGRPALAAEPVFVSALKNPSVYTRLATIRTLQSIGVLTPALREALVEAASTDSEDAVRAEAQSVIATAVIER